MENNIIKKVTIYGSITNVLLAIVKVLFGVLYKSQSLIADGVHSWSDLITDLVVIFGVYFWSKEPDEDHPYGHGRIETFITLLIGASLIIVALNLSFSAFKNMIRPVAYSANWITFIIAIISIFSKEVLFRYSLENGIAISSKALVANAWHHRSDALSSIPVALSIIIAKMFPSFIYTDQIATVFVSFFLIRAGYSIISGCIDELMEKEDRSIDIMPILLRQRDENSNIMDFHKIHARRLGSSIYISLHMLVEEDMTVLQSHILSGKVKQAIMESDPNIKGVIIHTEPY